MMPTVIELADPAHGSSARIWAEQGFNCFSYGVDFQGERVELLWSAEDLLGGTARPSRSGIPLLFPYAGRIRGTQVQFAGKTWPLEPADQFGNAIHGFVLNRPWRVVERTEQHVTGEFRAATDDPALLERWPADFRIRVTYALAGAALQSRVEVFNPSESMLPFWLGTHGYFRVPLSASSAREQCRIRVPASEYWELADLVPTGERKPVDAGRDLRSGQAFGAMQPDDVLTGLEFDANGWCTCTVEDPQAGRKLDVVFDRAFGECVVFIPPHREAICLEPYSSVPNAIELQGQGIPTGLVCLPPGETWTGRIEMRPGLLA